MFLNVIFVIFGAQLRKSNDDKVVQSTLLHIFGQGSPKGQNPEINISCDIGTFYINFEHQMQRLFKTIDLKDFDCN